ncbi:DUF5906 domain-containing protein [Methylobacterium mesophilicum]
MSKEDFQKIASDALGAAPSLLRQWFPNGKLRGHHYCLADISGRPGNSLKIDTRTGRWTDFDGKGPSGRDLISLRAAKDGITQGEAAARVAEDVAARSGKAPPASSGNGQHADLPVFPIPDDAPPPPLLVGMQHPSAQMAGYLLAAFWAYRDSESRGLFYVARFECRHELTSKGKTRKAVPILTYHGDKGWRWKGLSGQPAPLYRLDKLAERSEAPVLLVEGEKTVDAAADLFPTHVVTTWLGGTAQLNRADLSPLRGRNVWYWRDADQAGLNTVELVDRMATRAGVASLQIVNLPLDLPDGWDLADTVPEGVNIQELLDGSKPSGEVSAQLLRDLSVEELTKRFAYNVETDQFVDLLGTYRAQSTQINALFQHIRPGMAKLLLSQEELQKIQRFTYLPGNAEKIVNEGVGLQSLNLWRGSDIVPVPGDAMLFEEHLRYLCSTNEEFEYLANWLSCMIQKPNYKLKSAIVLVGGQGTGKSFVGHVMRYALGDWNVSDVSSNMIKSDFNQFLEAKLLIIVEEIMALGRVEIMNNLKPYITQPLVMINAKHLRPYQIENCANFLFLSNREDALKLENDDRRYFIVMSDKPAQPQCYYDDLWAWERENRGVILHWLLSRDLSAFNPDARPPVTEGKRRMVEAARDELEAFLTELIEDRAPPFEADLVELKFVTKVLRDRYYSTGQEMGLTRVKLTKAMNAIGTVGLGQCKGVIEGSPRRPSLWAVRKVGDYLKMSSQQIVEEHFRQKGGREYDNPLEIKF